MRRTASAAEGLLVEGVVNALALGGLRGRESPWLWRLLIAVVFVAELRGPVTRTDRQIHPLAASVAVRELAVEEFGIGWIGVSQPVPAFPQSIDVRVMQIEERVASDRGEFGHVAPEAEMREEVRVLIEPGIEAKAPLRRVDVELLVQRIETDPVSIEVVDPFTGIDPEPRGSGGK